MLRVALRAGPFVMFLVALAVGSAVLIRLAPAETSAPPKHETVRVITPVMVPPPPRQEIRQADVDSVRAELRQAEDAARTRAAEVDEFDSQLAALQARVDALRAELKSLEDKRAAALAAIASDPRENPPLERDLQAKREELTQLTANLADMKAARGSLPKKFGVTRELNASKLPAPVDLIGNRIAPVTKDFFHFPLLGFSGPTVVKRSHPGETIAEARQPDSKFANFLRSVRHNGEYLSCLLNADSFEAFDAVRQMAARAGVDVSWEPAWTNSGAIAITRVHLVRKPRSHDKPVALPDIVR